MDGVKRVLDAIYEEHNLEDVEDVEMFDVEEGELVAQNSKLEQGQSSGGDVHVVNQESCCKNRKCKNNKRKNRRREGGSGPHVTDINRFVLDACKHLKERKSYLVWTPLSCLGVSALSDLVKEERRKICTTYFSSANTPLKIWMFLTSKAPVTCPTGQTKITFTIMELRDDQLQGMPSKFKECD